MLRELLARWRIVRHVELADAIDRLTARDRPAPIEGKTVAARQNAWTALADTTIHEANGAGADPAVAADATGRLLATPVPGMPRYRAAMLGRLLLLPDDPRVAMAIAALLETDVVRGRALARAYGRLFDLRDVRVVPRLRAHFTRGGRVVDWIERLARLEAPRLPQHEAADVDRIGRPTDVGELHLEATLVNQPDDLAAYAVYADSSTLRGDPRGEFIALQLAAAPDEANLRRQRELLERYGRVWASPLDRWFLAEDRVFERGMFAGGRVAPWEVNDALAAWAFVRTIEVRENTELDAKCVLFHARRAGVFSLEVGSRVAAGELVAHLPNLRELHVDANGTTDLGERLAACTLLPALDTLGLRNALDAPAWIARAPVLDRVRRLVVTQVARTSWDALAARRSPALREIELHLGIHGPVAPDGWRATLHRTGETGPFDDVLVELVGLEAGKVFELASLLGRLPETWPRAIVVRGRTAAMAQHADELARFESAIARFTSRPTVEVPFARAVKDAPPGLVVRARIGALRALDATRFPIAYRALVDLGQHYETFTVNSSRTQRPLGKDPVARLLGWIAKDLDATTLRNPRGEEYARLSSTHDSSFLIALPPARSLIDATAWFAAFVAATGAPTGALDVATIREFPFPVGGHVDAPLAAWCMVFDPNARALLATATADELAAVRALATVDTSSTATHLAIRVGDEPREATPERMAALSTALIACFERAFERRHGFAFGARAELAFAPLVAHYGLSRRETHAQVVAYHALTGATLGMIAELDLAGDAPLLTVTATRFPPPPGIPPMGVVCRARQVTTAAELDAALADAVSRLAEIFAAR